MAVILHGCEPKCPSCAKEKRSTSLYTRLDLSAEDVMFCPACKREYRIVILNAKQSPIVLRLCAGCHDAVLKFPADRMRDGFVALPPLCAECEGKLAQCARYLASGGKIIFEPVHDA